MGGAETGDRAPCTPPDSHEVTLKWRGGNRESVRAKESETVLEAAESAGVSLPVGCRIGTCTTCAGRVREGTVAYARPPRGLNPRHLDRGYALLCIAAPRSDCRIEVGSNVRSDLVSNPWR